jgi:hypothetical protein
MGTQLALWLACPSEGYRSDSSQRRRNVGGSRLISSGTDRQLRSGSVTLTRIIGDNPAVSNDLPNAQTITCPRCTQAYRLAYSDSEWNEVKDWLGIAETALRRDRAARHEATAIPLEWPRLESPQEYRNCCYAISRTNSVKSAAVELRVLVTFLHDEKRVSFDSTFTISG